MGHLPLLSPIIGEMNIIYDLRIVVLLLLTVDIDSFLSFLGLLDHLIIGLLFFVILPCSVVNEFGHHAEHHISYVRHQLDCIRIASLHENI